MFTQKSACIYSSFIHNSQKLEATKISMGEWVNTLIRACNEILFRDLKHELSSYEKTKKNLKCILLQLKMLHTLWPIISLSEKGKTMAMIKESVAAKGSGNGGDWTSEAKRIYPAWYCHRGYMTLYLCENPQISQQKQRILMYEIFKNNNLDILGLLGWNAECDKTI